LVSEISTYCDCTMRKHTASLLARKTEGAPAALV